MRKTLQLLAVCVALRLGISSGWAQTSRPAINLVNQTVNESQLMVLPGNVHPLARVQFDNGPVPGDLPLDRMMLVLKRSAQQEQELLKLLQDQQDSTSTNYHRWLAPSEFGEQFGPSLQDVKAATDWLELHGFKINEVSAGRTYIEFSGNAAQVQSAFHTMVHKYIVNGQSHWANATNPEIPVALAAVIAGVPTLHNFFAKPQLVVSKKKKAAVLRAGNKGPHYTDGYGDYSLAPSDYAVIYNINPLYTAGINGHGATIAVIGRSNINLQDIASFRSIFNLPANNPQIVLNGPDPGDLGGGEEAEAVLDNTWSGAVAPNATVKFVLSASTNTADGVDLSEAYAVNHNVGDVMTESFGSCEASYTAAQAASVSSLAQQAAAEGITYMVSSGDNGSDGCDNPGNTYQATQAVSVNMLASPPYLVAVGGNQFDDTNGGGPFWNANSGNALSYIPEDVWNENCDENSCSNQFTIWAGSGGASMYFPKPYWQTGVTGIPNDTVRHVPDVSLTAAIHDPYLLCLDSGCTPDAFGDVSFSEIGGTSAAAPSFAGMMALVVQKTNSRQGLANPVLYKLAAKENLSACNGSNPSSLPAAGCVFNDVTVGTNAVPGEPNFGTPGEETYDAGVGYDMASGLGSLNAANMVNTWSSASGSGSCTYAISPSSGSYGPSATTGSVAVSTQAGCGWTAVSNASSWLTITSGASGTGSGSVNFQIATNMGAARMGTLTVATKTFTENQAAPGSGSLTALRFVPVTPCRIADTRNGNGPFGGPALSAGSSREFPVPNSPCGIPASAQAYSLNVTVVPTGNLGYLTVWPSGQPQPGVSTLNSPDGRVKANAAIVPAGSGGGVSVFASDQTNVILDVNGYFTPTSNTAGLEFFPVKPCRVADTRSGSGPLAGPYLAGGRTRAFPMLSGPCGLPASAKAFSLNITAVPRQSLPYLTIWATGQAQPAVSTLNAPTGTIVANAAIAPAGNSGDVSVYAADDTDLLIDVDGYFAAPANGGLAFYALTPCRALDTRNPSGSQPFSGTLAINIYGSGCAAPASAKAYILNATAVPPGPLDYLSLWANGQSEPNVSTLNAVDGAITSNVAFVPASNGAIAAYASNPTHLILDLSGYFAP